MILKRYIFLTTAFLGFYQILLSQDIKVKTLSLKLETSEVSENVNFYVENVIDNRFSKSYIGIVQLGFNNTRFPATFEQNFSQEIKAYLDVIFPKKPGFMPVIIRINELIIAENTEAFT